MMDQPRGTCGAPCLPACMPPVRGSSLHLQAALPGPDHILTRFPGEPWLFSGPRSLVVQAGRNHAALALQAFPLPFLGARSLLLSVWENAAINLPPHL